MATVVGKVKMSSQYLGLKYSVPVGGCLGNIRRGFAGGSIPLMVNLS